MFVRTKKIFKTASEKKLGGKLGVVIEQGSIEFPF